MDQLYYPVIWTFFFHLDQQYDLSKYSSCRQLNPTLKLRLHEACRTIPLFDRSPHRYNRQEIVDRNFPDFRKDNDTVHMTLLLNQTNNL